MKLSVRMTRLEGILGWVMLAMHLILLPVIIVLICAAASIELSDAALNIVTFVAAFLLVVAIFHRFLWKNLEIFLQDLKKSIYAALGGMALYFVLNIFVNIVIVNLMPDYSNVNDANISQMSTDHYWEMLACTVLLVPVTEEVLYRGMLFQTFHHRSRILAYVISVVAFSAIHMVFYIGTTEPINLVIGLFQYVPASIAFSYAYEKADSIWAPIVMHGCVNLIGMLAMR